MAEYQSHQHANCEIEYHLEWITTYRCQVLWDDGSHESSLYRMSAERVRRAEGQTLLS